MNSFREFLSLENLTQSLKTQYGIELYVTQNAYQIHIHEIKVPEQKRNQGIGTKVIQAIQQYAQSVNLPITLSPEPESRQKGNLERFYRSLGFKPNKGKSKDYSISSFFGTTWLWRPK